MKTVEELNALKEEVETVNLRGVFYYGIRK